MDFQQAEKKFKQLKMQFEAGNLTEAEFKSQLEELMVQDEGGNWWMIGYETELWYRHDGKEWVQTDPPGTPPQEPTPEIAPEPEPTKNIITDNAAPEGVEREATDVVSQDEVTSVSSPSQKITPKNRIWTSKGAIISFAVIGIGLAVWGIISLLNPSGPRAEPFSPNESGNPAEAALPEVGFDVMPGGALEHAIRGEFAGTTITVDGAFEGNDADGVKFSESMRAFEDTTGITVNYIGNKEFEASIGVRVDAGDAPDIVDFPQPGLFADFARRGNIVPVTDFISDEWLLRQYNPGWREFTTVDGREMGLMHRYSGKSLVWYPKAAWDAAGYPIPQTWGELMALTQRIADDGDTVWCIGIESGAATGWVATDWTEDMMLRTTSLENYDAWVAGNLPFNSPEVKQAIQLWSDIWFNDAYVYGGRPSIVSTSFGDAPLPMFENPPQCWLHRQANFITSFFPEGAQYGVDYDFFYLPPVDDRYGRPFLVAGDLIAMFNDRPEVRALMEYFTTPQSVGGWLAGGGAIAAQQTATQDMYGSDVDWGVSQLVANATSFRFDGSDLMPGEVGTGSFWQYITDYVVGAVDLDMAMPAIDDSWPR